MYYVTLLATPHKYKQKEIIETVISGNHTLAIMPTGAGKSLCY